ncbi:hypothetical protein J437_LFUL004365 [Ladona fulva]|uniref:Histone-binding protein RBBP4-like N-terminal domain-containing protein n=1 Tax=Ladona fulva TaxID=123851 RepID=A0A8K0K662_LADFU|nr:hypothetical protein J437_LFUL004365 [Ladona fulva]
MEIEEEVSASESEDESMSSDQEISEDGAENKIAVKKEVYMPGTSLDADEKLVCDQSVYVMLHHASTGSPCLSFDIIKDDWGDNRSTFPMSAYAVAGTESPRAHTNSVVVMKMSNIHKTQKIEREDDDDEESSDEEDEEKKPKLDCALIKHQGCVNRVRASHVNQAVLCATWSEIGHVNIWDIGPQLRAVQNSFTLESYCSKTNAETDASRKPIFTFTGHLSEGYGMDWCPTHPGVLATGDCRSAIHLWQPDEGASSWKVDQRPLSGHTGSVEDLQWSPNERHSGQPVATFKHHIAPVTTVEWHPTDSTVFASGGEDDQIALWDISLERDKDAETEERETELKNLPPQLLFIHQGQKEVKELHWHPQIPGVIISTAANGFNIFKTISV